MSHTTEQAIHRLVDEVINKQCLESIDEIMHEDYVYRTPGEELQGRQALKGFFTALHIAFPDLYLNIDDLISADDKAILLFTLTGTHESEFMGIPATGKRISVNGMTCSRFKDHKIIEEWELLDQLTLFQQLGIVTI